MKQSFRPDEVSSLYQCMHAYSPTTHSSAVTAAPPPQAAPPSDIMQRSVLGALLPEAMICFLENYEPGRFAETFLGEFETPEAIWNSEMRRMMIEKIASHIADFTPRLQTNTRATYQYLAMPLIQYPQLENELFCNIYYLKHLTDTQRYPDWPIKEPVSAAAAAALSGRMCLV